MKDIQREFQNFISEESLLKKGDSILAALSGGSDSVCLLLLLNSIKKEYDLSLSAMYIDHMIRGEESEADGNFSKDLCEKLGITFYSKKCDVPTFAKEKGLSTEEAARILRYQALKEKAKELSSDTKLAVAHNLQDQCETLLFRMARGTGPKGMSGMKPLEGNIIRPILFADKKDILNYLEINEQSYRTDITNDDINYSRNRVRKNIIPQLTEINSGALEHIGKLAKQMDELVSDLEKRACDFATENTEKTRAGLLLKTNELEGMPELFKTAVVREFIRQSGSSLKDISSIHYETITNLIAGETGKALDLPGMLCISKTYEGILLKTTCKDSSDRSLQGEIITSVFPYEDGMSLPTNFYTKWFDYDKINGDVSLRNRNEGDYLVIHPDGSKKKLKEWLINEKVPRELRDDIPILACGNDVLWVIGYRTGEGARITPETKTVLQVKYIPD